MTLLSNNLISGQNVFAPEYGLLVEGVPIPATILRSILSIQVNQVTNGPASFALQVNDPHFILIDVASGLFTEGKRVEISMGYRGENRRMIVGEITAISAELEEGGGLSLQVEGFDRLHAATRGTGYRQFRDTQPDSAIVEEIARDLQLTAVVDTTGSRRNQRVQTNVSNLEFLQGLAQANGFQLWVEDKTLYFKRHRPGPRVVVARGRDLISFSARLSTAGHVGAVEVRGWDPAQEQAFSARALASQSPAYTARLAATGQAQIGQGAAGPERVIYADGQVATIDEARTLAEAVLAEQRRSLLIAQGSAVGNPDLQVGSLVRLENMGRFSDEYVVEDAGHVISQAGYRTTFTMRQHL